MRPRSAEVFFAKQENFIDCRKDIKIKRISGTSIKKSPENQLKVKKPTKAPQTRLKKRTTYAQPTPITETKRANTSLLAQKILRKYLFPLVKWA